MKKIMLALLLATGVFAQEVKEDIEVPYIAYEIKTGEYFDEVQANCLTCHSFGYITNQGRQSKAFWREKVDKMLYAFKADIITKEDADKITEYLFKHYGNGKEE